MKILKRIIHFFLPFLHKWEQIGFSEEDSYYSEFNFKRDYLKIDRCLLCSKVEKERWYDYKSLDEISEKKQMEIWSERK